MNKAVIVAVCVGTIILIVGVVLGWAVFPNMIKTQIGESVELKPKTDQYERFKKLPLPFDFSVYIFHITNKDEVNAGTHQPIMKEIGPYVYRQTREKLNIKREADKNLINYNDYQYFKFQQEKSGKLKESDKITVVNPALNGIIQMFEDSFPALLKILNVVTPLVFNTDNIFLDTTVSQFLFEGFSICNQTTIDSASPSNKVLANAICALMYLIPAKNIKPRNDDLVFTFLNHKNNTPDGRYTINDGIKYKEELGFISKWNNDEHLKFWVGQNSTCNKVGGRDAVLYAPFLTSDSEVKIFNTDICRTVDLKYEKYITFRDVTAFEYTLSKETFNTPTAERNTDCYCLNKTHGINEDNGCLKDGVMDLFTCYSAPILLSFPHFMHAHADYQSSVKGLKPNEKKHRTYVHLEPNTGTPLEGSKRVQFNMFVRKVEDIEYLKNYKKPYIIPILWLDESVKITDDLYDVLYDSYISKLPLIDGVRWSLVAVGTAVIIGTVSVSLWKSRSSKATV